MMEFLNGYISVLTTHTGPQFDWIRVAYFLLPISIIECIYITFIERLPEKGPPAPVIPFIVTTFMGLFSNYLWWFDNKQNATKHDWIWVRSNKDMASFPADPRIETFMYFVLAYMIADFFVLVVQRKHWKSENLVEFAFHHLVMWTNISATLHYHRYAYLWIFGMTSEITNFFLNGKDLLPKHLKIVGEVLFALAFFGYRMCYMFPLLTLSLWDALLASPFDFFVILHGPALLVPLHFIWSYKISAMIVRKISPPKEDKKKDGKKQQ